ncbi:MAG: START domain-containing protein [Pseudomonadota bacterium]
MRRILLGSLASILLVTSARGAEEGWIKQSDEGGVTIYNREKTGSAIKEVKAIGVINAPPHACFNVVLDMAHFKDFMPYTKRSDIVGQEGERVLYSYQHLALPLISDRDYTLKVVDVTPQAAPGQEPAYYKKTWTQANARGPKPRDGVERVEVNDGFWRFDPIDGGTRTRATYYVFTDPGGMIPSWVANQANTQAIPNLFKALGTQSQKPAYQTRRHVAPAAPAAPASAPFAPQGGG